MPIQKLIDEQLLLKQQEQSKRERSGLWSPSRFGKCYRMQYWSRAKEPETNAPDIIALRRFAVGNLFHDYIQSFYPEAQREVKIQTDDIIGFADLVTEDTVTDVKSVTEYAFKYLILPEFDVTKEKEPNCLQVCDYAIRLNKPKASLIFVNIASVSTVEFSLNVEAFKPKLEAELKILRSYWGNQQLPPAKPKCYIDKKTGKSKECGYCPYLDRCNQEEGVNNGSEVSSDS